MELASLLSRTDTDILASLRRVRVKNSEDLKSGYELVFVEILFRQLSLLALFFLCDVSLLRFLRFRVQEFDDNDYFCASLLLVPASASRMTEAIFLFTFLAADKSLSYSVSFKDDVPVYSASKVNWKV